MVNNPWFKTLLAAGCYLSCFMIVFCLYRIPIELTSHGDIPIRINIILIVSLLIWIAAAYFSDEPAWKTTAKVVSYTMAMSFLGIGAYGVTESLAIALGKTTKLHIITAIGISFFGFLSMLGMVKILKSKRLN